MKRLHRSDLYGWSQFDKERNIDFQSVLWVRPAGNVIVDPLPLSDHDQNHLNKLGGAAWIVITNSDHIRAAAAVAQLTGAKYLVRKASLVRLRFRVTAGYQKEMKSFPG